MNRCSLCAGKNTCVPPSGPEVYGDIRFAGQAPGKMEDRKGTPFVGPTGRELSEHYMPLAGLRRDNCCVDNAIRCLPVPSSGRLDIKAGRDFAPLQFFV